MLTKFACLHLQVQRFELSTLESLYVIILQIVTDRAKITIGNKQKVTYELSIGISS